MPINPQKGESRDEFISRCISIEVGNGKDQDQAVAICISKADEEFKSATPSVTDNTWSTEAPINTNLSKKKRVIFNEDFNEDDVLAYKKMGFKVFIRSSRKIKKRDRKVWNKLQSVGLTEDHLVFGELKDLDRRYNFDLHMTGQDPILEALLLRAKPESSGKVIKTYPVNSIAEAEQLESEVLNSIDLKFVSVSIVYTYGEIPGIPKAKSGSRPFCTQLMSNRDTEYTLDDIKRLPNGHLKEMFKDYGLEPDVFLYRGGFYRLPGTLNTTPWCRHQWTAKVKVG
jgi:hypothetical protein